MGILGEFVLRYLIALSFVVFFAGCDEKSGGSLVDQSVLVSSVSPTEIAINTSGQTLSISGTDIYDMASVTIGGVDCTNLLVVNRNEVSCTIPSAATAGTVEIRFTDNKGNVLIWDGAKGFTYN